MTRVKFCGITRREDAEAAVRLGANALGFNFYSGSKRCIRPDAARQIVAVLPEAIWKVGVFVNHTRAEIAQILSTVSLDTLQFHGDESDEFVGSWQNMRTIRALRLKSGAVLPPNGLLLLDSYSDAERGGSGLEIPDELLSSIPGETLEGRVLLAGGLSPLNVRAKIERYRPFGVDVASGIEERPGEKSITMMEAFLSEVRSAGKRVEG